MRDTWIREAMMEDRGHRPTGGNLNMVVLFLIFWGTSILFSIAAASFYNSTCNFFTSSPMFVIFLIVYEVLICIFLMISDVQCLFHTLSSHVHIFVSGEVPIQVLCPFFCLFVCFFILQLLIRHQFYTHQCIHVNPSRPIQHTTIPTSSQFSPLGVHMSILYICVSTSALQTGSSVPFF